MVVKVVSCLFCIDFGFVTTTEIGPEFIETCLVNDGACVSPLDIQHDENETWFCCDGIAACKRMFTHLELAVTVHAS